MECGGKREQGRDTAFGWQPDNRVYASDCNLARLSAPSIPRHAKAVSRPRSLLPPHSIKEASHSTTPDVFHSFVMQILVALAVPAAG